MQRQSLMVAAIVVVTFAAGFFVGRSSAPPASAPPAAPAPSLRPSATPFPLAGQPRVAAPAAPTEPGPEAPGSTVTGTIAEVIQVPSFTYLRLRTASGDEWAATSANLELKVGQQVRLASASLMQGFASKTLGRTFDRIWFGELAP